MKHNVPSIAVRCGFNSTKFQKQIKKMNTKQNSQNSTEDRNDGNTMLASAALDKLATDIINGLDSYARDYDHYEYGLPTHDAHLENQIAIIKALISSCR
jgi:hypothetical protein